MKVFIDGWRKKELEGTNVNELSKNLKKYLKELENKGKVVKGFYIDGKGIANFWQLFDEKFEDCESEMEEMEEIEIDIQDKEELLSETLKAFCRHIDDLGFYAQDLNAQLQWEWNPEEILESSLNRGLIKDIEWVYKAIDCLQLSLHDELLKRDFNNLARLIEDFETIIREGEPTEVGNFLEHKLGKELRNIRGRLAKFYYHKKGSEI